MSINGRGSQVETVAIVFLTFSWVAVVLRCIARLVKKVFRIADWLVLAALASFTFLCAVVIAGAETGTGQHLVEVPIQEFSTSMMLWYCGEISYVITTALVKASIGVFLLQICIKKYQKITIWTVIVVSIVFSLMFVFVMAFQCNPPSYFWTQYLGGLGSCLPGTIIANVTYAHCAISIWADWTLGILPIFLVWNLNMNPRTKVSLAVILGLGAIGSTASIARFLYIHQLSEVQDFLWQNVDVSIWSTVEPGLGIIASSLATLRPLFVALLSHSRSLCPSSDNDSVALNELQPRRVNKGIQITTVITKTSTRADDSPRDPGHQSSDDVDPLDEDYKFAQISAGRRGDDTGQCTA